MASLLGNLNIYLHLHQLKLPFHSQVDLSSLNNLKVWGEKQKPHHDMAFLLVPVEDSMADRQYGLSIIWTDPSQVRADSMEEVVGKLTTCTPSGTDCPYTLVQLHEGTHHSPRRGTWASYLREGQRQSPVGRSANLRSTSSLSLAPKSSTL